MRAPYFIYLMRVSRKSLTGMTNLSWMVAGAMA